MSVSNEVERTVKPHELQQRSLVLPKCAMTSTAALLGGPSGQDDLLSTFSDIIARISIHQTKDTRLRKTLYVQAGTQVNVLQPKWSLVYPGQHRQRLEPPWNGCL